MKPIEGKKAMKWALRKQSKMFKIILIQMLMDITWIMNI